MKCRPAANAVNSNSIDEVCLSVFVPSADSPTEKANPGCGNSREPEPANVMSLFASNGGWLRRLLKAKQKSEFVKQGLSNSSANVAVLKGLNLDTYLSDVASRGPMEEMREPSTA
ncbi:MAG: hypothetical protein DME60_03975 [Verrucomicrobia bacterium]|nr:MAG: hypothetical protein DME60_03975 [Verrucomicrobiota bacterium]